MAQDSEHPTFSDNELYVGLKKEYAQPLLAEEGQLSQQKQKKREDQQRQ
jgi:hypothetical protein